MATIAENLQTIQNIKQNIKTAIENKGVTVGDSSFTDYPTLINNIPQENTGGGTGKIDIAATGIKLGSSTFTEIPVIIDFSNVTDMSNMFNGCSLLQSVSTLDTSKVNNMSNMFNGCKKITTITLDDTSNVTNMNYMFGYCQSLQSIPTLDTSNVTNMNYMFYYCSKLSTIPLLECGKVTTAKDIFGYGNIQNLTDLGGFKDLKISIASNFLDKAPNLTVDSLMNVINYLYDLTANGLSGQTLKFGSTNINKLTEEQIAVATAKGWTLTA